MPSDGKFSPTNFLLQTFDSILTENDENFPSRKIYTTKIFPDEVFPNKVAIFENSDCKVQKSFRLRRTNYFHIHAFL